MFRPELLQPAFTEGPHHLQLDGRTTLATARLDGITRDLAHCERLAGNEAVVDVCGAFAQDGIHGNEFLIAHKDVVADAEFIHLHRILLGTTFADDDQRKEILQRTIEPQGPVGVGLVPATDEQEEQKTGE